MRRTKQKKSRELLKNILIFLVTLVICFLFAELALRLITYQNPRPTKFHENYIYTLNPNSEFRNIYTAEMGPHTFKTNDYGFKGHLNFSDKKKNILLIGDSFVECYVANYDEECFVNLLDKSITGKYNILPYGVGSWSTDNEFKVAELESEKAKPETVIVFFDLNDYWENERDTIFSLDNIRNTLVDNTPLKESFAKKFIYATSQHSYIFRLGYGAGENIIRKYKMDAVYRLLYKLKLYPYYIDDNLKKGSADFPEAIFYKNETESENIKLIKRKFGLIIDKYSQLAKDNDFKLLFVIIPMKEQVNEDAYKRFLLKYNFTFDSNFDINLPLDTVKSILDQKNVSVLYPVKGFKQYEKNQSSYYVIDGHFNKLGNQRFANEVSIFITSENN